MWVRARKLIFSRRGLTTVSTADGVAAPTALAAAADAAALRLPSVTVLAPVVSLAANERELRLDLFRGLALWLIFIDHLSPDLLTWFTIRNYGFSDATEIFIFVSGYTAALVYGRAMGESGLSLSTSPWMKRTWP